MFRSFVWLGLIATPAFAVSIRQSATASVADENACAVSRPTSSFRSGDRQAFFWFIARQVRTGDRLRIEWVDPQGTVAQVTPYEDLPTAPALCFLAQLPIAGFPPASQPGAWNARVVVNDTVIHQREFRIAPDPNPDLRIDTVSMKAEGDTAVELTLRGAGFHGGSVVHVAQYTRSGGWRYLSATLPASSQANQLTARIAKLPPGEYVVVVRNPDDRTSAPARLLIATPTNYKLPLVAGRPWVVTQGPYGSFSHWNNSLHAWDIAPRADRCVVAMRAGIAYTHDLGMGQTPTLRSFGNYITIDHGDGEFSHYAHLASGTFVVHNGQRVEQGQALAVAGNSGYTLGEGGGYHVHVHVTREQRISSPSIPFRFEDLPDAGRGGVRGTVVSMNTSPLCDCRRPSGVSGDILAGGGKPISGSVQVAQWWSDLVSVPGGSRVLEVRLSWDGADRDLDLHLVAPDGTHYGWYGETKGYSGSKANPEQIHIDNPAAGQWRIAVEGMRGANGPMEFRVESAVAPAERRVRPRGIARRSRVENRVDRIRVE